MMKLLLKTTSESEVKAYAAKAQEKYGCPNLYRFQYRANDGKFYYEILWRIDDELLYKLNKLSFNMCGMPYEELNDCDQDMLYCMWEEGCIK